MKRAFNAELQIMQDANDLVNQAKVVQRTFLKHGAYWSVETCLVSLIIKIGFTNESEIIEAVRLALIEDARLENIANM